MYSRMDKYHGQKIQRFSIRKYSFGAASVAVAAYMMLGGAATVKADTPVSSTTASDSQTISAVGNQVDSSKAQESTETAQPTVATPTTEQPAASAEAPKAAETPKAVEQPTAPAEAPKAVEAPKAAEAPKAVEQPTAPAEAPSAKADTSKLEAAITRMEAALKKAGLTEKTASAIEAAKAELAKAQALLLTDKEKQLEVDYSTSSLKNRAFVLESMPKASTDKKENKNQDPRNGKAIPGQGESGFRAVDTSAANSAEEATKYKGERDKALPELQANIDKIQAEIAKQEAQPTDKKDQFKIDVLKNIKQKAENVITTANAADATSAQAMSQQAEAVKSERDLLAFYLAGKTELGAPVSENHVAYGNNPQNGVFESLKEGFGDKVTFTDADKKSETIATQYESGRDITNKVMNKPDAKDPIGSATYNWQEKTITKADAEAGMLNGWKIEKGDKVNAVKPLDVTNVTDKDGQPSTREVPKSKIYSNDGELKKYQTSGENSYVNGSGVVPSVTPTIDVMRTNAFGEVKNRDYYLELGSKGTTLSKEFDVNGNSRINVNLIHSAAYGGSTSTSAGERVKLKIVDAFTGKEIKPVEGTNGPLATEQPALAANGWNHLDRIYDIPAETTKIKVLIEAGSQGTNTLINDNNINIKDGYLIGGIGIATAPAAEVITNVRSENRTGEYGYTKDTIYEKGQKGNFDITIKDTGGMNIDYYAASNVEVTVEVPKGVVLEDKIYNANGGSNWLGNVWANTIKWVPNDPSDNSKGGKLTYNVPAGNRMAAAETNSRTTSIPFTAADNFVGPADFKVTVKSGFGDTDAEGNRLYSYTANGPKPAYENEFNRNGLANSDDPDYKYGKVIFINSLQTDSVITVPINTTDEQLKAIAYAKAQEAIKSPEFTKLLNDVTGTATLGDTNGSTFVNRDDIAITKVAEDGRGVVKVPVTYTVDGKTYETTVDIEVNVVKSKTKPVVVFEGDEITPAEVKEKVEPATTVGTGTANEPKASDIFKTDGKAGESGLTIPTTVTHNVDGTEVTEDVKVPVTVLPVAKGEVTVAKNTTPDKLKELAKDKAKEAVEATDFKSKLPEGATVTVGDVTEEVLAKLTAEKGTNTGTVNVPVTYTVDGKDYTTTIPVTVNVKASDVKPVYVVEGDKPTADDVNKSITPDTDGTTTPVTDEDINNDIPTTDGKVGSNDVNVTTKVTYPNNVEEKVTVPVTVLPKVKPEGVTVPKDADKTELAKVVKEKAEEAAKKLEGLPDGVTVTVTSVETTPGTDKTGVQTPATVIVEYKDKDGNKITKVIEVPVNVVSSTPPEVVVFEGDTPNSEDVKKGITPGEGGTVGDPTNVPSTVGKAGDKDVEVEVPVTYENGKFKENVKVPVTVLPKPTADSVIVPKDLSEKELKDKVGKDAENAINNEEFKKKLPEGATVKVDLTNVTLPKTSTPGKAGEVEVPVIYTVNGKEYKTTVKVPVTVVEGKEQLVPKGDTPDPKDNITPGDYPEGATFEYDTPVDTSKPGKKEAVVIVKDKDGNEIVRVPVVVNVVEPKVTPIIVPERTKLTKEDVQKHIEIPGVTGWEIVGEPELPETFPAGVSPSATVTVKLPNGKTMKVEVPVIATPTGTPIVVPQGTTITPDDVKKHVNIPNESGWEIVEVGEIPTTETPGDKTAVKVKVKLPTGEVTELEVPVKVTPKRDSGSQQNNGDSNYKPTPQNVPSRPTAPEQPVAPVQPEQSTTPNQSATQAQSNATVATDTAAKPATPKYVEGQKELPNTGTEDNASLAALGLLGVLSGFGLVARKKKED